ncbi:LysR family transcriptional regulator substrate-binding protein, partial [Mesorhizobium sp. M0771]|uniref:LysR family transcriptional regulator substrate-binding protein n=1 Tax=Mesorhizobium sp. M0771 TaxID=2956997 RepID=UPI00333C818E
SWPAAPILEFRDCLWIQACLNGRRLGRHETYAFFYPDHRFSKQTCIEAQDLAGETIVDIDPQFAAHQMNFNALRFAGVEPDILVEFDCNGHEAGYVSAGLGISITNEIIAREYAAFQLGIRPVEPSALYHYVAIWQKGRTFSNALDVTLEAIIAAFSQSARGGSSLEG